MSELELLLSEAAGYHAYRYGLVPSIEQMASKAFNAGWYSAMADEYRAHAEREEENKE